MPPGLDRAYLGIDGVTVHTLNVACALNGVGGVESQFVALGNRKAVLRQKKVCDIDAVGILDFFLNLECCDDRVL